MPIIKQKLNWVKLKTNVSINNEEKSKTNHAEHINEQGQVNGNFH